MPRTRSRDDRGSSATIGLLSALLILAPAMAYTVIQVQHVSPHNLGHAASTYETEGLLDQILRPPPTGWTRDPDNATTFGLGLKGAHATVDATALRALRAGGMEARTNGALDYSEARRALGIQEGDFHLRIRPASMGANEWTPPDGLRVAYVAHHMGAAAAAAATPTVRNAPEALFVDVEITNQAPHAAIFALEVALGNESKSQRTLAQMRHTPLLAPGERHTISVTYNALDSWDASLTHLWYSVADPYGNLARDQMGVLVRGWLPTGALPTSQPREYNVVATAAQPYFVNGSSVTFQVDHFAAKGGKLSDATAQLVIVDPHGQEVHNLSVKLPAQPRKAYQLECTNCTVTGTYTLKAWDRSMGRLQVEHVHLSGHRMFTEKTTLDPIAWREIQYLQSLVPNFAAARHDPTTHPDGDVFGDESNGPSELAKLLQRYDIVIVGSNVDQDALMPAAVRHGLHDWVVQGGSLIALGLQHHSARWLQATAHIGLQPTSDPAHVHESHTLLGWPNALRVNDYVTHGRAWRDQESMRLDAAVTAGTDMLLATSKPGAFGAGTILLSAFTPGMLTAPHQDAEGQRLLQNLVAHSLGVWVAELGPEVPAGVPVTSWKRIVWAEDSRTGARALVQVELLRFR